MKEDLWEEATFDEKHNCWVDKYNRRLCSRDNDLLNAIIDNCKEFLNKRNKIYIDDVAILLEKALEYTWMDEKLSERDKTAITKIRKMIKGL